MANPLRRSKTRPLNGSPLELASRDPLAGFTLGGVYIGRQAVERWAALDVAKTGAQPAWVEVAEVRDQEALLDLFEFGSIRRQHEVSFNLLELFASLATNVAAPF